MEAFRAEELKVGLHDPVAVSLDGCPELPDPIDTVIEVKLK